MNLNLNLPRLRSCAEFFPFSQLMSAVHQKQKKENGEGETAEKKQGVLPYRQQNSKKYVSLLPRLVFFGEILDSYFLFWAILARALRIVNGF